LQAVPKEGSLPKDLSGEKTVKELLKLCDAFDAGALPPERLCELVALARKAATKRAKESVEHRIPEDFTLTPAMREFAEGKGIEDPDDVFDAFYDWHRQKGTLYVDWEAAFRTWVRNQIKFNPPAPRRPDPPRQSSLFDITNRPELMPRRR
jgi:hypothetical protein